MLRYYEQKYISIPFFFLREHDRRVKSQIKAYLFQRTPRNNDLVGIEIDMPGTLLMVCSHEFRMNEVFNSNIEIQSRANFLHFCPCVLRK